MTTIVTRTCILLTFAFTATALMGCDAASGDDDSDGDGVLGLWQEVDTDPAGNETLRSFWADFSEDEIITYYFERAEDGGVPEDCYYRGVLDVTAINGDEWTYRYVDDGETFEQTITLRRDGEYLVVGFADDQGEDDEDVERYRRSTRTDFTPLCD